MVNTLPYSLIFVQLIQFQHGNPFRLMELNKGVFIHFLFGNNFTPNTVHDYVFPP